MDALEIARLPLIAPISEHAERDSQRERRPRRQPAAQLEPEEPAPDPDVAHTVDDTV